MKREFIDPAKLFDFVSDGVAIYKAVDDGVDFVLKDLNTAGEAIAEVKREDVLGKRVTQVFPGVKRMGLFDLFQQVYRTGETGVLPLSEYKDGRIQEWMTNTVYKASSDHIVAVFSIATREMKVQEALSHTRLLHAAILDSIPDLIWLKDLEGTYLICNEAFRRFVAKEEGEIIGKTDFDFFEDEEANFFRSHDRKALEVDGATANQEWLTFQDSGYRGLFQTVKTPMRDSQGNTIGVLGIARDISELWKANEGLRETKALLETAMDCSPAGIAIAEVPSGELRYVNKAALGIRGPTEESVVKGVGVNEYVESWQICDFDGKPLEVDEVPLARAVLYGETCNRQFLIRRKGEEDRVVWAHAAPVRNEEGETIAAIVVFPDITELKRAEEEKRQLEEQLQHALRLESIGRLAGGIAHDFNNMLTVISGNADLAIEDLDQENPALKWLEEIRVATERAASLTRDLLAFSRKQAMELRVISPGELLEGIRSLLVRTLGEDIDLKIEVDPQICNVRVDPTKVEHVLVNLAINARDAMPDGGELTITASTKKISLDDNSPPANLPSDSYLEISVSDTGVGIPQENLDKIFDPFFSTKGEEAGTGLGLSSALGTLQQHGGTIEVSSELGEGTTFRLYFPAAKSGD